MQLSVKLRKTCTYLLNKKKNMKKSKMHTPDMTKENINKVTAIFPNCLVETKDEKTGQVKRAIDFDQLRQELSDGIVEGPRERYCVDWPGRREALLAANAPINKTLRPCQSESVNFDTTKNIFIEGDNLDALKLLQETYLGKVKLIYIDPPYNTGNDFIYNDKFAESANEFLRRSNQKDDDGNRMVANTETNGRYHSDWLSMLYARLKRSWNLLADDGAVFISIDDNEQANLKRLCDLVFGESNFVGTIIWEKRYSPQNAVKWFSESHDFIIVYAKSKLSWFPNLLKRSDEMKARYRNLDNDPRGVWKPADATAQAGHGTKSQFYVLTAPNGKKHMLPNGRCWVYTEPVFQKMIVENRVWFGADGNNVPALKRFLSEVKQGVACQTIWKHSEVGHNQEGKKEVNDLFPEATVFETPKPVRLIKRILQLATDTNSLILDFFAGSSTTAHAVMQINAEDGGNRRYIMVQLPEACDLASEASKAGYKNIAEISKERIRRAGDKIKADHAITDSGLDTGFRVLKVDDSNMANVYYASDLVKQTDLMVHADNIKPDRKPEDLLFQVLVDWGVDLSLPIAQEIIAKKMVFFVNGNALVACFDSKVSEELVKKLAERKPLRVVFRDNSYESDSIKINVEQIFKLLSPETEVRTV